MKPIIFVLIALIAEFALTGCADGNKVRYTDGATELSGGPAGSYAYRYSDGAWTGNSPVPHGMIQVHGAGTDPETAEPMEGNGDMFVSMPAPFSGVAFDPATGRFVFASGTQYEAEGGQVLIDTEQQTVSISFDRLSVTPDMWLTAMAGIVREKVAEIMALSADQRAIAIEQLRTQAQMGDVIASSVLQAVLRAVSGGVSP